MIRIGRHDAHDKWEILCDHWAKPAIAIEPILDKWDRPAIPQWQSLAVAGGSRACTEYIAAKLLSLRSGFAPGESTIEPANEISSATAALLAQLGEAGLHSLVGDLARAFVAGDFASPLGEDISPLFVQRLREVFRSGALRLLRWTDMPGEVPSIENIRERKESFPTTAIRNKRKALDLFCAVHYGRNDVIHIHDICPQRVTLVDNDADCLNDMRLIYPEDWTYLCIDAKQFIANQGNALYDLVIADPPLTLATEIGWDLLPEIMARCSDTFITNFTIEMCHQLAVAPTDLDSLSTATKEKTGVEVIFTEMLERWNGVYWAVMRRPEPFIPPDSADYPPRSTAATLSLIPSIDIMHQRQNLFPIDAIAGKKTVLSLFSALNYGRSDVIHIYDMQPNQVTIVDLDADCLNSMKLIYPREWNYICSDFREFLRNQTSLGLNQYDLVVADPYLPLTAEVAWDWLPTVMNLCSDTFITNYTREMFEELDASPDNLESISQAIKARTGVETTVTCVLPRNTDVYWTVMRKVRTVAGQPN